MAAANGNNQALANKAQNVNLTSQQQKEQSFTSVITSELGKQFKAMKSLVPKHVTPERMARIGLQAISRNPKLMECTPESVVGAIMNCATLGLEPNLIGHAYLVPFWNGKTKKMEAQFQIGYKGLLDLVRRTGDVSQVYAYEVRENDEFDYELGVHANLKHKPAASNRGDVTGYYSVYHLKDGGYGFFYLSRAEALEHAERFSKSKDKDTGKLYGPWADHFDEMAKKTAMKAMTKYMPISVEAQAIMEGISRDESVVKVQEDKTGVTGESFFTATYDVDLETGEVKEPEKPMTDDEILDAAVGVK
ncbi:recombinase RecT [uncultured Anaeromusa sp.]|uniref:recombinase RecT n=1 Tax=uncultured Anaeromusa sp. TaxID=673273 RepID=UPI0029C83762|nr:recombinase RecT [uncultured Anaeromusa sp.]